MGFRDIRYAVRSLVMDRGVAAIVIICLALGINVNATLFSVIDGVLIQPLPYAEPDRLLVLNENSERRGVRESGVAYRTLQDWKERSTAFASMAGTSGTSIALSDGAEAERFAGAAITWDMFPILGVNPILGRHFRADDDRRGAEPVVMLSHEIWQRRYQSDAAIAGRSVTVNGKPATVIGVMPAGFNFPENQKIWIPVGPRAETQPRTERYLLAFGRLKNGVTMAQARGELTSMAASLATLYPGTNDGWSATASPLADKFIPDDVRLVLVTMMGAVTIVLLNRVRQRCEPDAGARLRASARVLRESGARRGPCAVNQAADDRMRPARSRIGAAWPGDRVRGRVDAGQRRAARDGAVLHSLGD